MTVVLDTNVVLQARCPLHPYNAIILALADGRFTLAASTAIFLEYEEIVTQRTGAERWRIFAAVLEASAAVHGNIRHVEPSFHFHLITADPDDDKFADCAIAAEADFIITEDTHFEVLRGSGHKPQPVLPGDFIAHHLSAA